jgi:glycerophosphoryl diester phosphodiesterase
VTLWAIAHRGASDKSPENTLAAFERALKQGADAIECDVHLSADGEVVVIHDDTVDRTTDGSGEVAAMSLEELRQLDAGSWKHSRFSEQRIPTLQEVIELVGDRAHIFVELKGSSPGLPWRVVEVLRENGAAERAWLFTAHRPTLEKLRQMAPEMRVRWREGMEGGDFVLTWPERITESTAAIFRERGMRIFVTIVDRTSNSEARSVAHHMVELGIDGVICNRVPLLREIFDSAQAKAEADS